ncbi:MAG: BMC domain-containing protein [Terrimicrobiaceae bacterium]|jgi:microcompartment protein CcmL/EutN
MNFRGPIGLIEMDSWSLPALLADGASRNSPVRLLGMEATGGNSVVVKFAGVQAALEAALAWCVEESRRLGVRTITTLLSRPDSGLDAVLLSPNLIHPLYNHREQFLPSDYPETAMKNTNEAIGILETQGLAAALEAADAMLKAANVSLVGKEKIGAAYVTIVIRGEVAAAKAAIEAGKLAAEPLGKVVAAHVIARPHADFLSLLPG